MRPIHIVQLDKPRPGLLLTRASSSDRMRHVTVAAITSTIAGLPVEVIVGPENGLNQRSAVSLDTIQTIPREDIGRQVGWLLEDQEPALAAAIAYAFALTTDDVESPLPHGQTKGDLQYE